MWPPDIAEVTTRCQKSTIFHELAILDTMCDSELNKKTDNGVPILNTFKRLNIYKCGIVGIGMECSS